MNKSFLVIFLVFLEFFAYAGTKKIVVATLEWPPYIGKKIENNGYIHEITTKAFERSGYKVEITFYPWARALFLLKTGGVDVLLPEYYSSERKRFGIFSDPLPGGPLGVYKLKSFKINWKHDPVKEQKKAFADLKKYRFGIVRGYINTKVFDEADFLIKEKVSSDILNMKKLIGKRVHFILIDKFTAGYILKTKFPDKINLVEMMKPAIDKKKLYLLFSKKRKGYRKKCSDFNHGLSIIKRDGTMDKIIMKYDFFK